MNLGVFPLFSLLESSEKYRYKFSFFFFLSVWQNYSVKPSILNFCLHSFVLLLLKNCISLMICSSYLFLLTQFQQILCFCETFCLFLLGLVDITVHSSLLWFFYISVVSVVISPLSFILFIWVLSFLPGSLARSLSVLFLFQKKNIKKKEIAVGFIDLFYFFNLYFISSLVSIISFLLLILGLFFLLF